MSFDHIRQIKPSAADLLSFMSFSDRQGIPENLIRHKSKANYTSSSQLLSHSSDGESSESDLGPDFEDDVRTLRDYSFTFISEKKKTFHDASAGSTDHARVVESHGQIDQWKDQFISILCDNFPTGEYETWETCRPLFPHFKSAISQRPASPQCLQQWAALL